MILKDILGTFWTDVRKIYVLISQNEKTQNLMLSESQIKERFTESYVMWATGFWGMNGILSVNEACKNIQ